MKKGPTICWGTKWNHSRRVLVTHEKWMPLKDANIELSRHHLLSWNIFTITPNGLSPPFSTHYWVCLRVSWSPSNIQDLCPELFSENLFYYYFRHIPTKMGSQHTGCNVSHSFLPRKLFRLYEVRWQKSKSIEKIRKKVSNHSVVWISLLAMVE